MSWKKSGILATVVVAAALLGGCSDSSGPGNGGTGGGTTIPASWGGTWQITSTTGTPLVGGNGDDVSIDALCAGLSVEELFSDIGEDLGVPIDLTCSGSWTDARANVTCTSSGTEEGCTYEITITLDILRTGDTFVGTQTLDLMVGPPCNVNESETIDIMGERLDTSQTGCDQNLLAPIPTDWGGTWSISEVPVGGRGEGILACPDRSPEGLFWANNPFNVDITGGFNGNTAQMFGSWQEPGPSKGCMTLYADQVNVTREGESFTGTRVRRYWIVDDPNVSGGKCSGANEVTYNLTGTRTSTDTKNCFPPRLPDPGFLTDLEDLMSLRLF